MSDEFFYGKLFMYKMVKHVERLSGISVFGKIFFVDINLDILSPVD